MNLTRVILRCIILLLIICESSFSISWESLLRDAYKTTGLLLHKCWSQVPRNSEENIALLQSCLKRKTFLVLERIVQSDVIQITRGIKLVRDKESGYEYAGKVVGYRTNSKLDEVARDWKRQVLDKIGRLLQSHVLKIEFLNGDSIEARHRHGHMPLMIFATIAMGMILVPMGFQFLAVLGGKALLLAILSLILTAIQGLKKIATSNVNYGLYDLPYQNPWQHGHPYSPQETHFEGLNPSDHHSL